MQIEIKLPEDLEDGGDVLDVFVGVGDSITVEQGLIEIETDKATVEVPSTHAGTVVELKINAGDSLSAGGTILVLETADAGTPEPQAAAPAPAAPEPAPAPPAPEPPAPAAEVAPPKPIAPPTPAAPVPPPQPTTPPPTAPVVASSGSVAPASPSVRRFAREVGVDLGSVVGTGPSGRITREDVLSVVRQSSHSSTASEQPARAAAPQAATAPAPAVPKPDDSIPGDPSTDKWGPVQIQKMPKIRKTIANKMHESWSTVPRVTNFDDADVTGLEAMRQASKADYAASGIKLTTMPFVIKACALALKSNPLLNASIDMANEQIIYKQYVNIGIAVDTDRGLVVPALRNADQLSIPSIARALGDIAASARTGDFSIDDLRGGTFTISNLGAIGGTYSTPIINTPEVAILLVGRSRKMPIVVDGEIQVRLMMPLSLSYDHRLVDGGAAARYLNDVIGFLSTPSRLLMAP